MVMIPFPVTNYPGRRPQEGAGRLINCRAEAIGDGGRAPAVRHRVPGLTTWGTSSETTFRGALLSGSTLYAAFDSQLVKFTSAGAATSVDSLDGSDRVFFAKNNKRPIPDIMIVCSAGAFTLASDVVASLADGDLPSVNSVCFGDGYFFATTLDGRCFNSDLNSTGFNSNNFITTEAKSDLLYRAIFWNGQLLLGGSGSIEVWSGQPPNDTGFPFNRSVVIQRGIAGAGAIAGHEDGFGSALIFVSDDNSVRQLNGYTPERISTPDLERLIEAVSDKNTLEASTYIVGGHPIWCLSCADWTWEYDLSARTWNERKSYLASRWRGSRSFNAFGKWLCGDTDTGNILEISSTAHKEVDDPLIAECWSAPVQKFPNRVRVSRADFDFSPGVGLTSADDNEADPSVEIDHSDDGGFSFSNPRVRKLGKIGQSKSRVTLFQNGTSGPQGRIWRVRMSDPCHFGLMSGDMAAELKAV